MRLKDTSSQSFVGGVSSNGQLQQSNMKVLKIIVRGKSQGVAYDANQSVSGPSSQTIEKIVQRHIIAMTQKLETQMTTERVEIHAQLVHERAQMEGQLAMIDAMMLRATHKEKELMEVDEEAKNSCNNEEIDENQVFFFSFFSLYQTITIFYCNYNE